jgi:hypothetical protein
MKYSYKIFTLIISFLFVFSCSDLEEDRSGILSLDNLQSEGDLVAALTPVYKALQYTYKNPHFMRTNTYGSDDITTWWGGNKAPLRVFDQFNYGGGENGDINWLDWDWKGFWRLIYYANSLINGLQTSTADESLKSIIEGEARFLRAFAYFQLVREHGNMPIILDGMTPTGDEQRATVLENYQHIEADLLFAESNLPVPGATANVGRVSSAAAKTLLADLYLTWAGWPVKDASKYAPAASKAKEVIDMGYHSLLPIDQLWLLENANSRESIFSVQFSKEEDHRNGHPAAFSFHMARGWSDCYPELQFFRDFPEGPRKDATFVTDIPNRGFAGGKIITKTPATIPWAESQRFHPMYKKYTVSEDLTVVGRTMGYRPIEIYRYAEVLLIYAEAKAASGGMDATALDALNQVKRRAAGLDPNTPDATVDVTSATVQDIIDEKGWELAAEHKRWFDLIRTETLEDAISRRDPGEQVALIKQPTKDQYITPIPAQAIATSNLVQNPQGFKIQ